MTYNNQNRADRAQAAIDAYCDHTGDRPDESHFRDLLSDMMHLAKRDRLDFAGSLRTAFFAFVDEGGTDKGLLAILDRPEGLADILAMLPGLDFSAFPGLREALPWRLIERATNAAKAAADPGPFLPDSAPSKVKSTKPLTKVREIAPGLYAGRKKEGADAGELQLFDSDYHRGYITGWATPSMPDGWRVHCWGKRDPLASSPGRAMLDRREFKRTYPTLAAAERALIREGAKLN